MKKKVIVVLGMHRSGTSLLANCLAEIGVYSGSNLMPGDKSNPKGYWEDLDINALNEEILAYFKQTWFHIDNPLFNKTKHFLPILEQKFLNKAIIILKERLEGSNNFLIKDPRMSILIPFWKLVFERLNVNVKYILTLRNPLDTAESLLKRNSFDLNYGINLWAYYTLKIISEIQAPFFVVAYDALLENLNEEVRRLSLYIGDAISPEHKEDEKLTFIDRNLRHSHHTPLDLQTFLGVDHIISHMYKTLVEASYGEAPINEEELARLKHQYQESIAYELGFRRYTNDNECTEIFMNTGEGFSQEQSIRYSINNSYSIKISIESDEIIDFIRLDPSTTKCVTVLEKVEFLSEDCKIEYKIVGGNYQLSYNDDTFIFENDDPNIVFDLGGKWVTTINVSILVFPLDLFTTKLLNELKFELFNDVIKELQQEKSKINAYIQVLGERKRTFSGLRKLYLSSLKYIKRAITHPRQTYQLQKKKQKIKLLFNEYEYLYYNEDLSRVPDLLEHFTVSGWKEQRKSSSPAQMDILLNKIADKSYNDQKVKKKE